MLLDTSRPVFHACIWVAGGRYNGLSGIVRGPAEKEGRYVVDVILFEDVSQQETQELSLKPDNLVIIRSP